MLVKKDMTEAELEALAISRLTHYESREARRVALAKPVLTMITAQIARETGLTVEELRGPSTERRISRARALCFMVARDRGFTCADIAKYFGRSRPAVMKGANKARERMGNGE